MIISVREVFVVIQKAVVIVSPQTWHSSWNHVMISGTGREGHGASIGHHPGIGSRNPSIRVRLLSQHLKSSRDEKGGYSHLLVAKNKGPNNQRSRITQR